MIYRKLLLFFLWTAIPMASQELYHAHLQELVVSGTRWYTLNGNEPVKISRLSFEEGNVYNPQTAADMLGLTGEVFIQKSQYGGGSPMIRGFSTNRLLYSVDGVRMNSAIFRAGNLQNVISLDPFSIASTEVLFGPGAVCYGSDAIGGVMVFNTIGPRISAGDAPIVFGSATARTASASGEKTAHVHLGMGFDKWGFITSFTSSSFDDLKQGMYGPDKYIMPYIVVPEYGKDGKVNDRVMPNSDNRRQAPSGYSQCNFMQKVRYVPTENVDLEYAFHFSETSEYARYDRHQRMKNGLPRYSEWNYGPQLWMMNHLRMSHNTNNMLYDSLRINMALQRFEESRISRDFNNPIRDIQSEEVDAWSVNADLMKSVNSRLTLMYGAEYVQNNVHSKGESTDVTTGESTTSPSRYPKARWYSYGIFLNSQWHILKNVHLAAGLRYNLYSIESDFSTAGYDVPFYPKQSSDAGSLCGNIGINWFPKPHCMIRLNYSRGFRAPNVDDMGKLFDSVDGCVTVPNPNLKPEYADNVEIGVVKCFGDFLELDLSAYYTVLDNAIVRRDYLFDGSPTMQYKGDECRVQALQNAAVAKVWGVQFSMDMRFSKWFYAKGNINYQYGREELDDGENSPSRHAAPLFGRIAAGFNHKKLSFEAFSNFQAKCKAEDIPLEERDKSEFYALDAKGRPYSPAWMTINVRTTFRMMDNLHLNATLENIADRRYRPYSCGISAPGRNFTASITYTL